MTTSIRIDYGPRADNLLLQLAVKLAESSGYVGSAAECLVAR
jgi:hypothetical protein